MFAITSSRRWVLATTAFCTSTTSRAVLGRSRRLVMLVPRLVDRSSSMEYLSRLPGASRPLRSSALERGQDQAPRRQAVLAPGIWRHKALVRATGHPVGFPLRQGLRVGWRPATVGLEPSVGVADRLGLGHGHFGIMSDHVMDRHLVEVSVADAGRLYPAWLDESALSDPGGDLEDVSEPIAHHRPSVAVWGVEWFLQRRGPAANRPLVDLVCVIDGA